MMFSFFHATWSTVREIMSMIPENRELRKRLDDKNGHIASLDSIIKTKEQTISTLSGECERLKEECAECEEKLQYVTGRKEHYKSQVVKANTVIQKAKKIIAGQNGQIRAFSDQIDSLAKQDGKFWEAAPGQDVPSFRTRTPQSVEIIAIMNLKGGVGKTTITANLGATLWTRGKRVLLVDLDYQRTLTNLLLSAIELNQADLAGRWVDKLFAPGDPSVSPVFSVMTQVGDDQGRIIAAREELADLEEHIKAQWLLKQYPADARFLLRKALHHPLVQSQFDFILLDCPPRLTLASINALACCDHVLVPVVLDKASAKAIPRHLRWLQKLRAAKIAPELKLLGIVSNGNFYSDRYTRREANILSELKAECDPEWGEPVHFFQQGIPRKAAFAHATETKDIAASTPQLQGVFGKLVAELSQRLAGHESQPTANAS